MKTDDSPPEQPEPTAEEQAKAERAIWIIYGVMALFILAPLIVYFLAR
ncbi:MAG: hypothetical protein AAFX93_11755 [Verrucomicrobiota bacterium]